MGDLQKFRKSANIPYKTFWIALLGLFLILVTFWVKSRPEIELRILQVGEIGRAAAQCDYKKYILGSGARQDDPCLVDVVRTQMLVPPSTLEYNTSIGNGSDDMSAVKLKIRMLQQLLKDDKEPKFFIECGAHDGKFLSTTLTLEKTHNWSGLLIEPNPGEFQTLLSRHRKAWSINAAACVTPYAEKLVFYTHPNYTALGGLFEKPKYGVTIPFTVQCVPIFTILQALNVDVVDFLSLDTEGTELAILETVPFDKIIFKFLSVEHAHIPGGRKPLQEFMESKGYFFVGEIHDSYTVDSAFVHASLRDKVLQLKLL